jgi:ligand-binding SRPBCC domain-containing protein
MYKTSPKTGRVCIITLKPIRLNGIGKGTPMSMIRDQYIVKAPVSAISAFHHSTTALKKLSPPPVIVQIHHAEPLGEGSISEFTLWFGPLPLRWLAIHSSVDPAAGFTDTQSAGPMARWSHHHSWSPLADGITEMTEQIEYEHKPGLAGLHTRILFAPLLLRLMMAYRQVVIRRECE